MKFIYLYRTNLNNFLHHKGPFSGEFEPSPEATTMIESMKILFVACSNPQGKAAKLCSRVMSVLVVCCQNAKGYLVLDVC
jgi:hypothetical protein